MTVLTKINYYNSEQDYYLDTENPADCKVQERISDRIRLYGLSESSDQFAVEELADDFSEIQTLFLTETNLEDARNFALQMAQNENETGKYVVRIDNGGQLDKWFFSENSESFAKRTLSAETATIYTNKKSALAKAEELHIATNKQRDYWVAEINGNNEIVKDFIFN